MTTPQPVLSKAITLADARRFERPNGGEGLPLAEDIAHYLLKHNKYDKDNAGNWTLGYTAFEDALRNMEDEAHRASETAPTVARRPWWKFW